MIKNEIIKKALEEIKTGANYDYFFSKLDTPDWIEPLKNKGFFKSPPKPYKDNSSEIHPFWPESKYLKRMSNKTPELVIKTILDIEKTDNIRVHEDCTKAVYNACKHEPELAAEWARKEAEWLKSNVKLNMLNADDYGNLIIELAKYKKIEEAIELLKTLLVSSQVNYIGLITCILS